VRFRRSTGSERAQLKWFVAGGGIEAIMLVTSVFVTIPNQLFSALLTIVVSPLLPIAATIAILRYHLYDIDRILSRTVAYALVTGLLAGVFAILVVALQALLAPFTGSNALAVAGSTLAVAAAFQPLRRRIQRLVDRRFNRSRFHADRIATGFAGLIRDQVEMSAVVAALDAAVDRAVQPSAAAILIRRTGA
jgi:4-amino-4-deoxy-L-arabinose transferase-like glycosyltransferase